MDYIKHIANIISDDIHYNNGNLLCDDFGRLEYDDENDVNTAKLLAKWYEGAISKTSKYVHPDISGHLLNSDMLYFDGLSSKMFGRFYRDIFIASHWAPNPNKAFDGVSFIRKAAKSNDKIIMMVPRQQADYLKSAGFKELGSTKQFFGGEVVDKFIMANKAVVDDDIAINIINHYIEHGDNSICDKCGEEDADYYYIDKQYHKDCLPFSCSVCDNQIDNNNLSRDGDKTVCKHCKRKYSAANSNNEL